MASQTLEKCIADLDDKAARLLSEQTEPKKETPWWESVSGTFAKNRDYVEAMKLGRTNHESLRQSDDTR